MGLEKILSIQEELEWRYLDFLSRLDTNRTASLRQLISNPAKAKEILHADWLDETVILERLSAVEQFFNDVVDHEKVAGYDHFPLIIFQSTDQKEDEKDFSDRLQHSLVKKRIGHLSFDVKYLCGEMNYAGLLTEGEHGFRLHPLRFFSSQGPCADTYFTYDEWKNSPRILGYRSPDYPRILQVSPLVATDYFLRMIIHDLGHALLPTIDTDHESIHNIVMLYASGEVHTQQSSGWESLIHQECTDPLYFLDALPKLRSLQKQELTGIQKFILGQHFNWYGAKNRHQRRKEYWGIEANMSLEEQRELVIFGIHSMMKNGFPLHIAKPYCYVKK